MLVVTRGGSNVCGVLDGCRTGGSGFGSGGGGDVLRRLRLTGGGGDLRHAMYTHNPTMTTTATTTNTSRVTVVVLRHSVFGGQDDLREGIVERMRRRKKAI